MCEGLRHGMKGLVQQSPDAFGTANPVDQYSLSAPVLPSPMRQQTAFRRQRKEDSPTSSVDFWDQPRFCP